jgi:hypothetical protein
VLADFFRFLTHVSFYLLLSPLSGEYEEMFRMQYLRNLSCECSVAYPDSYFLDKSSRKSLVQTFTVTNINLVNCSFETVSGGTLEWSRGTLGGVLGE